MEIPYQMINTPTLEIAYRVSGPTDGLPVILLHGCPSEPHDYDDVLPALVEARCRVYTLRSGQQAALGADLRDFLDALKIDRAIVELSRSMGFESRCSAGQHARRKIRVGPGASARLCRR
jgi:pimeloyl-ACP methyl ester carboxylesterase